MATNVNIYKVKLVNQAFPNERVKFEVSPELSESRSVNYTPLEPIHSPGQIYIYKNSTSRTFSLGEIKLISRNQEEASQNLINVQLLRSWSLPWFGSGGMAGGAISDDNLVGEALGGQETAPSVATAKTNSSAGYGIESLGAPPAVLLLTAYSAGRNASYDNINRVPVVMSDININYPTDADYIPTEYGAPFPTIMTMSLTLLESQAPIDFEAFSLADYKQGNLPGF